MGNIEHKFISARSEASSASTLQKDYVEQASRRLALMEYFSFEKESNDSNLPRDTHNTYSNATNDFNQICDYLISRCNNGLEFKNTVLAENSNNVVIKFYEKKLLNIFNSTKYFSNEVVFEQITVC